MPSRETSINRPAKEPFGVSGQDIVIIACVVVIGFVAWEVLAVAGLLTLSTAANSEETKASEIDGEPIYIKSKKTSKATDIRIRNVL